MDAVPDRDDHRHRTEALRREAHIDRAFISAARALDTEAARTASGTGLDARAFLVTRPWVKTSVRIDIDDVNDPTPYWLVSSRHPRELAAALGS